jgi:hypothetical protein
MRIKVAIGVLVVLMAAIAEPASAINGPRAVRHIRQAVAEDCHSHPAAKCLYWEVSHCYKLSARKVRCHALQQYRYNGNWRECRFNAAAVEERHGPLVHLHFGRTRCYSESGELIPER